MKKSITLLFILAALVSCTNNEGLLIEETSKLLTFKPIYQVDEFSINYNTPDSVILVNVDQNGNPTKLWTRGWNKSGDLNGPSSISISIDNEKKLIVISTKNATGSIYTGWDTWEDTYYLSYKDSDAYINDENKDMERYFISLSENPPSLKDTKHYIGYLGVYKHKPNILIVEIQGDGGRWLTHANYQFQDSNFLETFMRLHSLISKETSN